MAGHMTVLAGYMTVLAGYMTILAGYMTVVAEEYLKRYGREKGERDKENIVRTEEIC